MCDRNDPPGGAGGDKGKDQPKDEEHHHNEKNQIKTTKQHAFLISDKYDSEQMPDLEKFNPDSIKLDATIVAVGKRRTGKSWVFRNLMYLMKDKIQAGIVISQTDPLNKFWQQYVPKKFIFDKYHPEIIQSVFDRQKAILNNKDLTEAEKDKKAPFFILLDDVISDQRLKYDEHLMELFVAGRHYRLFVLITTQYAKAITPTLRGNTDYVFMMRCVQSRQREALWEDFADFMVRDAFYTVLDNYTEDNECLVVDTCADTVTIQDTLFWWKAVDPGKFKVGSKEYWDQMNHDTSEDVPEAPVEFGARQSGVTPELPVPYNYMIG